MENKNTGKKLARSAAIVSLAAALAATPIMADGLGGTSVSAYYAYAYSTFNNPSVSVEVSCVYGGDSMFDNDSDGDGTATAEIDLTNDRIGDARRSYAAVYANGDLVGYDEWLG